jgi:hypothetical protein
MASKNEIKQTQGLLSHPFILNDEKYLEEIVTLSKRETRVSIQGMTMDLTDNRLERYIIENIERNFYI